MQSTTHRGFALQLDLACSLYCTPMILCPPIPPSLTGYPANKRMNTSTDTPVGCVAIWMNDTAVGINAWKPRASALSARHPPEARKRVPVCGSSGQSKLRARRRMCKARRTTLLEAAGGPRLSKSVCLCYFAACSTSADSVSVRPCRATSI